MSSTPTRKPSIPSATQSKDAARPALLVIPLEDRLVPTGQVLGTVFLDTNANGLLDPAGTLANAGTGSTPTRAESGVGGVVVTAFDAAGAAQGSATSAANGTYTLNMTGTGPYRLEFTNLPANLFYGPQSSAAGGANTGVQFVPDGNSSNINLGLVNPAATSATNPTLLTNTYVEGTNPGATIVAFPFNSGTQNSDTSLPNYRANPPTTIADNSVVGATWGLAFDTANNNAYAAAFTKRHTSFGIGGPGAIYTLDPTGTNTPTLFADLNALVGTSVAGSNFRTGYTAGTYSTDTAAFDKVGKSGLGGLAVDDTGTYMYTVGLASRQLYRIRIPANGASPTAADVTAFNIPLPASVTGVGGANGALGDLRPFAVEFYNGVVYVGAVNSAETTGAASDLKAYVFAFSPTANSGAGAFVNLAGAVTTTQAVFTQALNYPRGFAHIGDANPSTPSTQLSANWNAWVATPTTLAHSALNERYAVYPQPELTGLAFDSNGTMTLGLRDRNGDQYGNFFTTDFPAPFGSPTKGISGGDTLRATIVTPGNLSSGWTAENITAAPPSDITGPTAGGQFFWQQDLPPNQQPTVDDHQALSDGGVLQLPGSDLVAVTGFDPIHLSGQYDLGGVRWYDTTGGNAGGINKAYEVYQNSPTGFAKANGIGDLIAATPLGREIGNRIWNDANGNGRQDPGEAGIQNARVVLVSVSGGVTAALATATTDANGNYYFSSYTGPSTASKKYGITQLGVLAPAGTSYQVQLAVADPALAGLQLTTFQAAGTNTQNDSNGVLSGSNYIVPNVGAQRLGTSDHSLDVGFQVANANLSGFVYEDTNPSNTFNAGDTPIAGVTLVLTGTTTGGTAVTPQTTTTDASGAYAFSGLAAGTYAVTETQPAGYLNRGEQPGTTGGTAPQDGTHINAIPLAVGQTSASNNFGEVRPVQLSGFVYQDITPDGLGNGVKDAPDAPIPGVTVVLTGTTDLGAAITPVTSTTAADGSYSFTALRPGTYSVSETQPAGYITRTNNPGTTFTPGTGTAGTVVGDVIQNVVLNSNANSPNNNFGEILSANAALSGFVYIDANNDGIFQGTETPIPGTTVILTGTLSTGGAATPRTTTTDATGAYSFTGLPPGTYSVHEIQPTTPANLLTGKNTAGTATNGTPGTAGAVGDDNIRGIVLNSFGNSPANNFGEVVVAQLAGTVYEDLNDNGVFDSGTDAPIPGTTVVLTGTNDLGAVTPVTSTTAADGSYAFTGLRPGTYTVSETQPAGYLNRTNTAGTTINGTTGTVVGDTIQTIGLNSGGNSPGNNFGEVRPVQLSGFVYQDINDDGIFNAGDAPIGAVTVVLTGTDDLGAAITPVTSTTAADGSYAFTALRPGTYTVTETQPAGYISRSNNPGTSFAPGTGTPGTAVAIAGGAIQNIVLRSNANNPNDNFGEKLLTSNLSGYVYYDPDLNGIREPNLTGPNAEPGIAGVTVKLYQEVSAGVLTLISQAKTDANGFYSFTNLPAGNYRVVETQPLGYPYNTKNAPGSTGGVAVGNNTLAAIPLPPGVDSTENDFGHTKKTNLFGYVWVDANKNGIYDPGEAPIPGAVVTIGGTAFAGASIAQPLTTGLAQGTLTAITDANGRWEFNKLPPGTYNLVQTNTPVGYQDFRSQNASGQSVQTSTATSFGGVSAQAPAQGPLNFGKVTTGANPNIDPSKQNFLGSSVLTATAPVNPLVGPPTTTVNTTPPFGIGTGGTTPTYVAVGAGAGFSPIVRVFDYASQTEVFRFQAFESTMTAGVRVTTADVNGDGVPDIICAAGPGAGPRVRVFDGATGNPIMDFYAFPPQFRGGVYVAAADFNGDGKADLVCGAGEGGGPNVRVFDGATGTLLTSFYAFDSNQTGGVRIAVGDVNGDGTPDIIASNGPGNTSLVRTFSGKGFGQLSQFTPYSSTYTGGLFVAAGDVNGDGKVEIVTGADQGGGPNVRIFNGSTGQLQGSFFAYESSFTGGVRVTVRDITGDGKADIITGAGIGGASRLRVFSGATLLPVEEFYAFDSGVRTGVYVG